MNDTTVTKRPVVRSISRTMSWIRWSARIASIEDVERRKSIAYVAFPDEERAWKFYHAVTKRRPDWKWKPLPQQEGQRFHDGRGLCKPRKSERLTDYPYEVKWHYPDWQFVRGLIAWDNGNDLLGYELTEAAYNNR